MFLCELQTRCDTAGIRVLKKHSPYQSALICSYLSVRILYLAFLQVYKSIFTSPSSAKDVLDQESDAENMPPAKSQKTSSKDYVRRNVATKLNLNNKVTPRSIAYAAVQVCVFVLYAALCLSMTVSFISTCKLRVHGLQFMMDSTTGDCIIMLLMSSRIPLGRLQRNVPKIYSSGGLCECSLFLQRILD